MYEFRRKYKRGNSLRRFARVGWALLLLCGAATAAAESNIPDTARDDGGAYTLHSSEPTPERLSAAHIADPLESAPEPEPLLPIDRTLSLPDSVLNLEEIETEVPEEEEDDAYVPLRIPNLMPTGVDPDADSNVLWMQTPKAFPRTSPYHDLGEYDWKLTRRVLEEQGAVPVHDAEGIEICEVQFFPYDIFLPDEPFPLWLNKLHVTTIQSPLVRRTPMRPGDDYTALRREDARAQIRNPTVFSSVVIVPVESADDTCVDVYVITRDIWSLRVGFQPQISGGALESLELSLVESNFLGLNDTIGIGFAMDQGMWEIGPIWKPTWVLGGNVDMKEHFRLIFDREFGGYDGIRNQLRIERPLRSSWDKDAWYVDTNVRHAHERVFDGRKINTVRYRDEEDGESYDVDERWRELRLKLDGGYVRAWGLRYKTTLTVGAFMDLRSATSVPMDDSIPRSVLRQFETDRLPRSERAMGPVLKWAFYSNAYFHLTNYDRFEVSESYRKGIHLLAELRYSETALGADVRFVDGTVGARYTAPLGDDAFIEAAAMGGFRWGASGFVDRRAEFSSRLVMPSGPLGRFVARGWLRILREDTGNTRFRIGAAQGLRGERGYVAEGRNAWLTNLEWRSKPVEVLSTFLGFAAFVDLGSAWERHDPVGVHVSLGAGIRFMAPQAMAMPAAIDISWPVGRNIWARSLPAPMISLHFGQIFNPTSEMSLDEFHQ